MPAGGGDLTFWTSYDTEEHWDFLFVEARTAGSDDWTTLPDANGHTSNDTGESCPAGWFELHPFLEPATRRSTRAPPPARRPGRPASGTRRRATRTAGSSGRSTSSAYAGQTGRDLDRVRERLGHPGPRRVPRRRDAADGTSTSFETGSRGWTVSGPPPGSGATPTTGRSPTPAASRSARRSRRRSRCSWATGSRGSRRRRGRGDGRGPGPPAGLAADCRESATGLRRLRRRRRERDGGRRRRRPLDLVPTRSKTSPGPVEVLALVRRHQARAEQRAAALHGRVDRDVHEHAGVVERLPEVTAFQSSPISTGTIGVITSPPSGSAWGSITW